MNDENYLESTELNVIKVSHNRYSYCMEWMSKEKISQSRKFFVFCSESIYT